MDGRQLDGTRQSNDGYQGWVDDNGWTWAMGVSEETVGKWGKSGKAGKGERVGERGENRRGEDEQKKEDEHPFSPHGGQRWMEYGEGQREKAKEGQHRECRCHVDGPGCEGDDRHECQQSGKERVQHAS
ncbi:hypothetical protein BDN70DRAFT_895826 [Pholiota conissans]|uniref:Uncharacterized protein n=1 Tax=Pholiota conissans TaxID=109636 RepID=A0A9P5YYU2_9AGAR|nr:hypothetical protein BDN70DRAFT_895826 [Pholiota conissans]